MKDTLQAEEIAKDVEREREEMISLMEKSVDEKLLQELIRVYGGGDSMVATEKDLVASEGTHCAGTR